MALLAIVYVAAARLGLLLEPVSGFATLVWPPSGIAVATLIRFGIRLWPGVALGAFAVNVWIGAPILVAAGIALGNTLEGVIASVALQRLPGFRRSLDRVPDVLGLIVLAAGLSTGLAATIGTLSLLAGDVIRPEQFAATWSAWWIGDALGVLIVGPLVLTWSKPTFPSSWKLAEAILLSVMLFLACALVFRGAPDVDSPFRSPYMLTPLLLWAVLRYGQTGVVWSVVFIFLVAIWGTAEGRGPFARGSLTDRLFVLQGYMATVTVTFLSFGALMAERARDVITQNQRKDEFLAMLGHELRNPLAALATGLTLLGQDLRDPQARQRVLAMLQRQSRRMTVMLDQLLDASRIARGKVNLASEVVDLTAVAQSAAENVAALITERRHELSISAPALRTLLVRGDEVRLVQIIENLLSNAAKYSDEGSRIWLTLNALDSQARISVRDTGSGIDGGLLPTIFDLFTQGPRDLHRRQGGLGLGLPLVRMLVEKHGGKVEASSPGLGRGSEFVVTLPRLTADPPATRRAQPQPPDERVAGRRVLVVDDEEDISSGLAELLRAEGCQALGVTTGEAALVAAREFNPDVVLLDLGLPGIDGYEVARRLRDERGSRTLLVAITGYGKDEDRLRDAGFDLHLLKPPDVGKILAVIAENQRSSASLRR